MARARAPQSENTDEFTCPECGRTFSRAAALGAHRRRAHGVAGASSRSRARSSRSSRTASTRARQQSRRSAGSRTEGPSSSGTTAKRARARTDGPVDRDALLEALFPNGIPAKESIIRAVNGWLDEAERLARLR